MGTIRVKMQIMPESIDINLKELKQEIENIIIKQKGRIIESKEEPIAFGLNALLVTFSIDEKQELEPLEAELQKQSGVNSTTILQMNREL